LIGNNICYNRYFFFAEGVMWFQHVAAAKTDEHHVETAIA